jgi:hypothetical protein
MSPKASSKGANPLLEVDADVITAAPTKVLSHFLMLTKDIHTPSGQTKPNLTHLCETCQPSPLQAGGRDTPLALKSPRSNSAIASRAPPIIRVGQLSSVAKSDDAGVNKAIWNDRVWIPLKVSESIIQQCTVLLHTCPLDKIRAGLLGRCRRGITLDLLMYLRKEHGSRWSTNPLAQHDKKVGRQCLHHVAGADWWEWKAGSTLCEHTGILRALIKYPQGVLEEIQEKTLTDTEEKPKDRQDHMASAYATERYVASRALLAQAQARQHVRCSGNVSAQTPF